MQIVIPAKPDGNNALNAFALGVHGLVKNGAISLNLTASLSADQTLSTNFLNFYTPILPLVTGLGTVALDNQANLTKLNTDLFTSIYIDGRVKLEPALYNFAKALLKNSPNGKNILREAFMHAYLRHCAKKFGIAIAEKDYDRKPNIAMSNVYILSKLTFIQTEFEKIDQLLVIPPTSLQQLENLFGQLIIVNALNKCWNNTIGTTGVTLKKGVWGQYIEALDNNLLDVGEIELGLLAEQFSLNLTIERWGYPKLIVNNAIFPQTITLHNELNFQPNTKANASWSLVLPTVPIANLPNYDWYIRIRRCYQFLDNIFDERIENLGYEDNFQPDNTAGYINFNDKFDFFQKFREKFTDEQSQIYGWRGLATWVATKDIEVRNSKRADGLNHTMEEFWILSKILERCPAVKDFAERTSILNENPPPALLVDAIAILFHIPFKIIKPDAAKELVDVTRANFTYRTQKDLVKKRYTYARYIEYAGNPSKFIMHFHLNLQDKDPEMKKEVRKKLGIYKDNNKLERNCKLCFRPFEVCFRQGKRACLKIDSNLYTYEGWSVRNCCNLVWLAFLGIILSIPLILAITLPRGLYRLANEPDNSGKKTAYDILNPFASTFLSILIGSYLVFAINKGHNNIHNLYHDRDERHEYHKDMAKILYATKLYNIVERIQLKIEKNFTNGVIAINETNIENEIKNALKDPYVNNTIEKVINNHINEATKAEKNPIEDITQNTGENLQFQRIRRSYIKWDAGVRIKEEIKKKQIKEFYRHYGLFKEDDRVKNNITRPTDCYSFNDCYDGNKFDNLTEITQQLPFNAADIPKL